VGVDTFYRGAAGFVKVPGFVRVGGSFVPLSSLSEEPVAGAYYLAPNGDDGGDGSVGAPWKTLRKASAVMGSIPGATLYLRGGIYNEVGVNVYEPIRTINFTGTEAAPITVKSYPGERAVFDGFAHPIHPRSYQDGYNTFANTLLYLNYPEWVILENFDVRGGTGRGLNLREGNNVIIRGVRCYKNHADGCYISAGTMITPGYYPGGNNNIIEDCDFFDNFDINTGGNSASGLKIPYNRNQIVRRCRFYNNSDDGLDMYGSRGPWLVEDCLSFNNGYRGVEGQSGNGCGYKCSGGASSSTTGGVAFPPAIFRRNISARNLWRGVISNSQGGHVYEHSTAWMDGGDPSSWGGGRAYDIPHVSTTPANNISSCIGLINPAGGGANYNGSSGTVQTLNSWQQSVTLANAGFISTVGGNPDFLALSISSPCRGAGVGGTDLGAVQYGQRFPLDTSVLMDMIGGINRVYA
jgi:hypothetical protein